MWRRHNILIASVASVPACGPAPSRCASCPTTTTQLCSGLIYCCATQVRQQFSCRSASQLALLNSCWVPPPLHPNLTCVPAAVVHVIDAVLLPARTLQEILPYSLAIGGLQARNVSKVTAPAPAPRSPVAGEPAPAPALASSVCYPSLEAAIAATPELSIQRQQLPLSGVSDTRAR